MNGPIFPNLVNVACYGLNLAGIQLQDLFSSCFVVKKRHFIVKILSF